MMWKYMVDMDETDVILEAFRMFDADGSWYITDTEVRNTMASEGATLTNDEVDGMIKEADIDEDGKVNLEGTIFFKK